MTIKIDRKIVKYAVQKPEDKPPEKAPEQKSQSGEPETVRDRNGLLATGMPIWTSGITAPPPAARILLAAWQEPISRRFTKRIQADILRPKVFYVC